VAWAIYHLCRNPAAEARLAAEVRSVLGPPPAPGEDPAAAAARLAPGGEQLGELRFMGCVLKETLRLRPPGEGSGVEGTGFGVYGLGSRVWGFLFLEP
jgi:cytochrome P450